MRAILLVLSVAACSTPPVAAPRPVPGATPSDACSVLARLQCAEGIDASCSTVLARAVDAGLYERRAVECVAGATTQAEARACGIVGCSR